MCHSHLVHEQDFLSALEETRVASTALDLQVRNVSDSVSEATFLFDVFFPSSGACKRMVSSDLGAATPRKQGFLEVFQGEVDLAAKESWLLHDMRLLRSVAKLLPRGLCLRLSLTPTTPCPSIR